MIALSAMSGRGAVAMWGYPLWLFFGLWIVLALGGVIEPARLRRMVATWAVLFGAFAFAFIANYSFLPVIDHRYRAAFYPGDRLADEMATRFRITTGHPLAYVIGSMWDGGNISHYASERPRVLIDGDPQRAPWIDLADLRARGAVVVWTCGENVRNRCGSDPGAMPAPLRRIAGNAQVQPLLKIPFRRGDMVLTVGWAILPPSN